MLVGDRADSDAAAAAGREVLQRFLDRQDWPKDVGVELAMALLLRHGLERLALQNSRIVHQHIHDAEDVRRFFAHVLHVGRPGDLSLEYDRLATMAGHLRHGACCSSLDSPAHAVLLRVCGGLAIALSLLVDGLVIAAGGP